MASPSTCPGFTLGPTSHQNLARVQKLSFQCSPRTQDRRSLLNKVEAQGTCAAAPAVLVVNKESAGAVVSMPWLICLPSRHDSVVMEEEEGHRILDG